MLNKGLLLKEFIKKKATLFPTEIYDHRKEKDLWQKLCGDTCFLEYAYKEKLFSSIDSTLNNSYAIDKAPEKYGVIGVDGSQIYPDKHQGTEAFLLNSGTATLWYGFTDPDKQRALFSSQPYFFSEYHSTIKSNEKDTIDIVNAKRQELELATGYTEYQKAQTVHPTLPTLICIDGPLLFFDSTMQYEILGYFLQKHIDLLLMYAQDAIPLIGYISLPKTKDLVELLKKYAEFKNISSSFTSLNDANLASCFLSQGTRSPLFLNKNIAQLITQKTIQPYFCYLATRWEIVRIEMPYYIAKNPTFFEPIFAIIYDQIEKGLGYPVPLAEAHEQAVITGNDRNFFYSLLKQFGIQNKKSILPSEKVLKKKFQTI